MSEEATPLSIELLWQPLEEGVTGPERKHDDDSGYDIRAWSFEGIWRTSCFQEYETKRDPETGLIPGVQSRPTELLLNPGERVQISAGYAATVGIAGTPAPFIGYDISVCSRSGTPYKEGLMVANQPGTVDAGYRGPILVNIINNGGQARLIKKGDRIAQMVIRPVLYLPVRSTTELPVPISKRGAGGFGSTGKD